VGVWGVLVVKAEEESGEEEGEKSRSPVRRARSPMMQSAKVGEVLRKVVIDQRVRRPIGPERSAKHPNLFIERKENLQRGSLPPFQIIIL
jgi:hypothetical protein